MEFIPTDNTNGKFESAGHALNHGAAQARNDVMCLSTKMFISTR